MEAYVRYMDDFLLFARDKRFLADLKLRIAERLADLRLSLNWKKSLVFRTRDGIPFLS